MKLSEIFVELERLADEEGRTPTLVASSALKVYRRWLTLQPAEREWLTTIIEIAVDRKVPLQELLGKKERSVADTSNR